MAFYELMVCKRLTSIHGSQLITTVLFHFHLFNEQAQHVLFRSNLCFRHEYGSSCLSSFFNSSFIVFFLCSLGSFSDGYQRYKIFFGDINAQPKGNGKKPIQQQQPKPMSIMKIKCPYALHDKITFDFGVRCVHMCTTSICCL